MTPTVVLGTIAGSVSTNYNISIQTPKCLDGEDLPCRACGPDEHFPPGYGLQHQAQIWAARRRCFECPVFTLCLEWAVPQTALDGIWAATTPLERRRIRKRTAE